MTALRILHVVDHTAGQRASGYSIRTRALVAGQAKLGLEPHVVTTSASALASRQDEVEGVEFVYPGLEGLRVSRIARALPAWRNELVRLVEARRIDVLHAHSPYWTALPALRASRATGLPVVYEVRGLWHESAKVNRGGRANPFEYWLWEALEAYCCRRANGVVAISEGLRNRLIAHYGVRTRVSVVPNGVDLARFERLPGGERPPGLPGDGSVLLGYIGSLRRLEGLSLVIEALARMDEPLEFVIIGAGDERRRLAERAQALGVSDRVCFLGEVGHAEVPSYYAFIDVLVFPRERNLVTEVVTPLKPLEAMAMGKPLLASDVGGMKELLPDERFLFRAGDGDDFVAKLRAMLADRDACRREAISNREFARSRDWQRICERYLEVYAGLA
jgi:glycosyltransferase involved in cell wall biosynthesis